MSNKLPRRRFLQAATGTVLASRSILLAEPVDDTP